MKQKRFSDEQIIGILKEADAGAVGLDLCRKHGMSSATFYTWKSKYGGLEEKNAKLKRLLAEAMLDNPGLKDLLGKNGAPSVAFPPTASAEPWATSPAARRDAVAHLRANLGVSERRACSIIGADRTSMRYRSQRGDDTALRLRLRELAQQRRRIGYRRLHILLLREGVTINRKKAHPT